MIVDRLEAVEVDEEHGEAGGPPFAPGQGALHLGDEHGLGQQSGERIVECLVRQLFLQELPVGDVARIEHEALDGRVGHLVAHDAFYRPPRSVFVSEPVLRRCGRGGVGRGREVREDGAEARSIVLVQERKVARPDELFRPHPDQLLR